MSTALCPSSGIDAEKSREYQRTDAPSKAHVKYVTSRSSSANFQICALVVLFVRVTAA